MDKGLVLGVGGCVSLCGWTVWKSVWLVGDRLLLWMAAAVVIDRGVDGGVDALLGGCDGKGVGGRCVCLQAGSHRCR